MPEKNEKVFLVLRAFEVPIDALNLLSTFVDSTANHVRFEGGEMADHNLGGVAAYLPMVIIRSSPVQKKSGMHDEIIYECDFEKKKTLYNVEVQVRTHYARWDGISIVTYKVPALAMEIVTECLGKFGLRAVDDVEQAVYEQLGVYLSEIRGESVPVGVEPEFSMKPEPDFTDPVISVVNPADGPMWFDGKKFIFNFRRDGKDSILVFSKGLTDPRQITVRFTRYRINHGRRVYEIALALIFPDISFPNGKTVEVSVSQSGEDWHFKCVSDDDEMTFVCSDFEIGQTGPGIDGFDKLWSTEDQTGEPEPESEPTISRLAGPEVGPIWIDEKFVVPQIVYFDDCTLGLFLHHEDQRLCIKFARFAIRYGYKLGLSAFYDLPVPELTSSVTVHSLEKRQVRVVKSGEFNDFGEWIFAINKSTNSKAVTIVSDSFKIIDVEDVDMDNVLNGPVLWSTEDPAAEPEPTAPVADEGEELPIVIMMKSHGIELRDTPDFQKLLDLLTGNEYHLVLEKVKEDGLILTVYDTKSNESLQALYVDGKLTVVKGDLASLDEESVVEEIEYGIRSLHFHFKANDIDLAISVYKMYYWVEEEKVTLWRTLLPGC